MTTSNIRHPGPTSNAAPQNLDPDGKALSVKSRRLDRFASAGHRILIFHPDLSISFGREEAILLGQLMYWSSLPSASKQGYWVFKTTGALQQETGLSPTEQRSARRTLVDADLIREERARYRVWFQVIRDPFTDLELIPPGSAQPPGRGFQKSASLTSQPAAQGIQKSASLISEKSACLTSQGIQKSAKRTTARGQLTEEQEPTENLEPTEGEPRRDARSPALPLVGERAIASKGKRALAFKDKQPRVPKGKWEGKSARRPAPWRGASSRDRWPAPIGMSEDEELALIAAGYRIVGQHVMPHPDSRVMARLRHLVRECLSAIPDADSDRVTADDLLRVARWGKENNKVDLLFLWGADFCWVLSQVREEGSRYYDEVDDDEAGEYLNEFDQAPDGVDAEFGDSPPAQRAVTLAKTPVQPSAPMIDASVSMREAPRPAPTTPTPAIAEAPGGGWDDDEPDAEAGARLQASLARLRSGRGRDTDQSMFPQTANKEARR